MRPIDNAVGMKLGRVVLTCYDFRALVSCTAWWRDIELWSHISSVWAREGAAGAGQNVGHVRKFLDADGGPWRQTERSAIQRHGRWPLRQDGWHDCASGRALQRWEAGTASWH